MIANAQVHNIRSAYIMNPFRFNPHPSLFKALPRYCFLKCLPKFHIAPWKLPFIVERSRTFWLQTLIAKDFIVFIEDHKSATYFGSLSFIMFFVWWSTCNRLLITFRFKNSFTISVELASILMFDHLNYSNIISVR